MFNLPKTKTEIAQMATQMLVTGVTASAVATVITENTEKTSDDLVVEIPSTVVGWYIGLKLKPLTDATILKIATKLSRNKVVEETTVTA